MQKLDPKVVWIFFLRFLFSGLVFFIVIGYFLFRFAVMFFMSSQNCLNEYGQSVICDVGYKPGFILTLLVILFLIYIIFSWIWAKLTYRFWLYQLTEDVFKKEHGVIWKKYVSIPYERIQNVDIRRGVIERILGLSTIQIQTAGYSAVYNRRGGTGIGAEGYLPGINKELAEQLREKLIKKAKGSNQGL